MAGVEGYAMAQGGSDREPGSQAAQAPSPSEHQSRLARLKERGLWHGPH